MPSLLKMMRQRSDSRTYSRLEEDEAEMPATPHDRPRGRPVKYTAQSAATRGLYATPTHRKGKPKRAVTVSVQPLTPEYATGSKDEHSKHDPIIKHSMYPQMIGKRRSELEAQARTRTAKYDRTVKPQDTARVGRPVHQQRPKLRARTHSVDSSSSSSSGYSLDGNLEGRPVRVCIYPQAKYIKEPFKASMKPTDTSALSPPSRPYKRSSLPGEEYQFLVRRQKMQHAREVLEPHFAHHGVIVGEYIWHGMMQGFTMRNSERRRTSKMQYAVRKALRANLDLLDADFKLAMNRHADKVYFCELSDVDGVPVDGKMLSEFIQMYQDARDALVAANLLDTKRSDHVQARWIDQRNHRVRQAALALRRKDSVAEIKVPFERPRLISRFSWDSSDGEVSMRQRLTKSKR